MRLDFRRFALGMALSLIIGFACTPADAQNYGGVVPIYKGGAGPIEPEVYIPPPPTPEPNFQMSLRYWASEGSTSFSIDSARVNPALGSPTSVLDYDGMQGRTLEYVLRAENPNQWIFKGFFGGGWLDGGNLDDEDYFAGQVKFSDTSSSIEGDNMLYGTIDIGKRFSFVTAAGPQIDVSPFVGFNYWGETADAYGARCTGGTMCPPGTNLIAPGSRAIRNEANWYSLRLGTEVRAKFYDRITLIGDFALLPVAGLYNEDSHFYRNDLGPVPNIQGDGTGWGYQIEAAAQVDITENWALTGGFRYWYAETNGTQEFVASGTDVDLNDFTSERIGVYGDVTYKFFTF
ncbi:MAG: outer membrane protein [Methyloligella sp. ZOD6]